MVTNNKISKVKYRTFKHPNGYTNVTINNSKYGSLGK